MQGLLGDTLSDDTLIFGETDSMFAVEPGDGPAKKPTITWQEFLRDPAAANTDVSVVLSRAALMRTPADALADQIAGVYARLFPLVLLAVRDEPLAAIANYLDAVAPPAEDAEPPDPIQPAYPLTQCAGDTGFPLAQLEGWVRAIERKGQAILSPKAGSHTQRYPAGSWSSAAEPRSVAIAAC